MCDRIVNSRGTLETGSNRASRRFGGIAGSVVGSAQALTHQKHIVDCRHHGETDSGMKKRGQRNPDPAVMLDLKQQHKKNRSHLGKCVGLAEDAGTEVTQARDGVQHRAGKED